ncbi:MAG: hypothetical protein KAY21_08205 [Limnohabitans sp.]|nr:hypothetical protein [Limnohabitans sp.]
MTQAQDKDDAEWLAALAGQENTAADASTRAQAEALRTALLAQSQRMDSRVPLADDAQYQQLLFRLRREGLSGHSSPFNQVVAWGRAQGQMAARTMAGHNLWAWGLAACAVLVVGLALQWSRVPQGSDAPDMRLILRGQGTVLIVSDPKARASELVAGLKAAGVEPAVVTDQNGQIQLKFLASDAALAYLSTQRIEPQPVEGWVTLTLVQPQKKPD